MHRFVIFLVCLASFGFPLYSSAQIGELLKDSAHITFSKEVPEQGDTLSVFIESNTFDVGRARAQWYLDGVLQKTLGGKERFTFTVPYKTETVVSVRVETASGSIIENERRIQPQSLALLWQADSFVPPFYKGKRKLPYEGTVTFTPVGTLVDKTGSVVSPNDLVYTWRKNGTVLGSLSGLGKKTLTLKSDIIGREFDIVLHVSTRGGEALAITGTYLEPGVIEPVIYRDDPLSGLDLSLAGSNGILTSEVETRFFVIPFFASVFRTGDPRVETTWTLNNERVEASGPWDIRVRQGEDRVIGQIGVGITSSLFDLQDGQARAPLFFRGATPETQ